MFTYNGFIFKTVSEAQAAREELANKTSPRHAHTFAINEWTTNMELVGPIK